MGVVTGGGVEEEEDGAFDRKENIPAPLPLLAATGASLLVEGGEGGGREEGCCHDSYVPCFDGIINWTGDVIVFRKSTMTSRVPWVNASMRVNKKSKRINARARIKSRAWDKQAMVRVNTKAKVKVNTRARISG